MIISCPAMWAEWSRRTRHAIAAFICDSRPIVASGCPRAAGPFAYKRNHSVRTAGRHLSGWCDGAEGVRPSRLDPRSVTSGFHPGPDSRIRVSTTVPEYRGQMDGDTIRDVIEGINRTRAPVLTCDVIAAARVAVAGSPVAGGNGSRCSAPLDGAKALSLTASQISETGASGGAKGSRRTPELDALGGTGLLHMPVDLMDSEAPGEVVLRAVEEFGGLDILVNNAGGPPPGVALPRFSFLAPTDDDWRLMFEFNLFSVVRAVRAAIPPMLQRGGGSIVNVSSGSARLPAAMNVDYNAAKAGLNNLTKALSEEFAPQGIRVNTVSPGPVRTAWWTEEGGAADIIAAQVGTDRDSVLDSVAPEMMKLSTGRLVEPQEVADVIALLASSRSASTTGADFAVDAGSSSRSDRRRPHSTTNTAAASNIATTAWPTSGFRQRGQDPHPWVQHGPGGGPRRRSGVRADEIPVAGG
jgi:NAD(P)-dependent dehydrogenase (short-subunit alcohol dehydrogenase family)